MRNLLNPKWLFIVNTLPVAVLFILLFGQFDIIKTLLNEENIRLWELFGLTLGILLLLNFVYASYLTLKKKNVPAGYGIAAFLCYIPFIYLYGCHTDDMMPFSIPQWMISGNIFLYAGTFLMPTLVYSLFVLVVHFTPESKTHKAWVNFLTAIGIPVIGYLFSQTVIPLWKPVDSEFNVHIFLVLIIVTTLVFLFFLVRSVFIFATKKAIVWQKYQLVWKIPVAVIFPLLGLAVNSGCLFNFGISNPGVFGNFNNQWFYILATINGIFICLPNLNRRIYRLLLFIGRSATFAYTLYFFLVFLPFLPLSVIAVIAFGTGFLMLTPLLLFVIHVNGLSKDFTYLKSLISKKFVVGIALIGFGIIPACITATYLGDKRVLNETLAYLYSPDYSRKYNIDKTSLQKTLDVVKSHQNHNGDFLFSNYIPYLSSYFNWIVLDNLTLSDAKINTVEQVFFGSTSFTLKPENIRNTGVKITNITANSVYDQSQNAWKSWVDLEITNKSKNGWFAEYATTIHLPEGCWISDYYLYVGDRKEYGILTEKKSAMWVFSQIRNENRDPGILYYLTGNKIAFRVFPFSQGEIRKTGIEFLHKEPVKLTIDCDTIILGNAEKATTETVETGNIIYVSPEHKQSLKAVRREPHFFFLVDVSKDMEDYSPDFTERVGKIMENNKIISENTQICFVNTYANFFSLDGKWKEKYLSQTFEGGFYLDRAIKTTLFHAYKNNVYPVIVVVTDSIAGAVLDKDFSDFKFAFPESDLFFNLNEDGILQAHSLVDNPLKPLADTIVRSFDQTVLEYELSGNSTAYLPNNNEPSIILKNDIFEISEADIRERNWMSALTMQGSRMSQILHPETSDEEWLNMVKYSFISKVMTSVTSYLVVENEAQKAVLQKKQEQVLSGNRSLDLDDDTQRMSEPGFILLTVLLGIALWYMEKRKKRTEKL